MQKNQTFKGMQNDNTALKQDYKSLMAEFIQTCKSEREANDMLRKLVGDFLMPQLRTEIRTEGFAPSEAFGGEELGKSGSFWNGRYKEACAQLIKLQQSKDFAIGDLNKETELRQKLQAENRDLKAKIEVFENDLETSKSQVEMHANNANNYCGLCIETNAKIKELEGVLDKQNRDIFLMEREVESKAKGIKEYYDKCFWTEREKTNLDKENKNLNAEIDFLKAELKRVKLLVWNELKSYFDPFEYDSLEESETSQKQKIRTWLDCNATTDIVDLVYDLEQISNKFLRELRAEKEKLQEQLVNKGEQIIKWYDTSVKLEKELENCKKLSWGGVFVVYQCSGGVHNQVGFYAIQSEAEDFAQLMADKHEKIYKVFSQVAVFEKSKLQSDASRTKEQGYFTSYERTKSGDLTAIRWANSDASRTEQDIESIEKPDALIWNKFKQEYSEIKEKCKFQEQKIEDLQKIITANKTNTINTIS